MNMPAIKTETATAVDAPKAATVANPVVTMTPKRPPRADKYVKMAKDTKFRADVAERIGLGFELS